MSKVTNNLVHNFLRSLCSTIESALIKCCWTHQENHIERRGFCVRKHRGFLRTICLPRLGSGGGLSNRPDYCFKFDVHLWSTASSIVVRIYRPPQNTHLLTIQLGSITVGATRKRERWPLNTRKSRMILRWGLGTWLIRRMWCFNIAIERVAVDIIPMYSLVLFFLFSVHKLSNAAEWNAVPTLISVPPTLISACRSVNMSTISPSPTWTIVIFEFTNSSINFSLISRWRPPYPARTQQFHPLVTTVKYQISNRLLTRLSLWAVLSLLIRSSTPKSIPVKLLTSARTCIQICTVSWALISIYSLVTWCLSGGIYVYTKLFEYRILFRDWRHFWLFCFGICFYYYTVILIFIYHEPSSPQNSLCFATSNSKPFGCIPFYPFSGQFRGMPSYIYSRDHSNRPRDVI